MRTELREIRTIKPINVIVKLKYPIDTGIKLGIGFIIAPLVLGAVFFIGWVITTAILP